MIRHSTAVIRNIYIILINSIYFYVNERHAHGVHGIALRVARRNLTIPDLNYGSRIGCSVHSI